jgi:hypothetical protein
LGIAQYIGAVTDAIARQILPAAKNFLPGVAIELAKARLWAFKDDDARKYLPLIFCEQITAIAKKEKVIQVQDGKVVKIVPDDGTAALGGYNRDEQLVLLATNFQLFKRRYDADDQTKFQRFKEQTKRMKMIILQSVEGFHGK